MTPSDAHLSPAGRLRDVVAGFVAESAQNSLGYPHPEPAFDAPLVGFSSGGDPLYREYVRHIDNYACGLCQVDVPCMDHIPLPEEG